MKQRVAEVIRRRSLWGPGQHVAVAVSGGSDSLALLSLLQATVGLHRGKLSVITIDHQLHPDSARWTERVEGVCDRLGVPCVVRRVQPVSSSEADARSARYAVFDTLDCDRVALAHHRLDQAETVLLNLIRGTQGRGLSGMRFCRGRYVRPLLGFDPLQLRRWCHRHKLDPIEDPANRNPQFLRVRVRRELLPLLEDLREGAIGALGRTAAYQAEDDAVLEALAADLDLTVASLRGAPEALARRRLRQTYGWLSGPLDAVLTAVRRGEGTVQVGPAMRVEVRGDTLQVIEDDEAGPDRADESR